MKALHRPHLRVHGFVTVPGDKSISHRALFLSALATGTSRIRNLLDAADVRSTAAALAACGVSLTVHPGDETVVHGVTLRGLREPHGAIDCGNSGTTARLLAGILAGHPLDARLVGDPSLSRRPMARVAAPLRAMGARVDLSPSGTLPMHIRGGNLSAVEWRPEVASAQIKSAILLAGLCAGVPAAVREPAPSRDHTERMFGAVGAAVHARNGLLRIEPPERIRPLDLTVPGDPSSAAFFIALGLLAGEGELRIPGVMLNPTRTGFLDLVRRMGADILIEDADDSGPEPVGTIVARPSRLAGIEVGGAAVPGAVDELPLLAALAARASGDTVVRGASELRVKESDRIAVMVANLRAIGADAEELPDGFVIRGSDRPLAGTVRAHDDHRIAMTFGILAAIGNDITIDDPACVAVSFPGFWDELARVTA